MTYSNELVEFCTNYSAQKIAKSKQPDVLKSKESLIDATKFLDASLDVVVMANRFYCVQHNIESIPLCKSCGKVCGFFAADHNRGFNLYCSKECRDPASSLMDEVNKKLSDKEWMQEKRVVERLSTRKIAVILGISEFPVIKWLKIHDLKK